MTDESANLAEACAILAHYFNLSLDVEAREAALNDERISDALLDAELRTLPAEARQNALARCARPELLRRWAESEDAEDRRIVAFHGDTPSDVLRRLSADVDERVRGQLAFNPNSDPEVLQTLFADPSQFVKDAVETAFETEEGLALRAGMRHAYVQEDEL